MSPAMEILKNLVTSDAAQIEAAIASLADAWNRHDGHAYAAAFAEDADFVNVLGQRQRGRAEITARHLELFRTIMDVNLTSTFWMCRAALRHMLAKGSGSIVNMASAAAFAGGGGGAVMYATSKAAIVGLTRALAKEVGPKGEKAGADEDREQHSHHVVDRLARSDG